jgi:transposase-like protein
VEKASREQVLAFRQDIRSLLQRRLLEAVEGVLEEELSLALGTGRYERSAVRRGYRNGSERRRITTGEGIRELEVPRGRVETAEGTTTEFRSRLVSRYARRSAEVDEAILACYLAGANSRRIRKALSPLLGEENLSKSAVSRVVARLKELFAQWSQRELSGESCAVVFLDGFHLKVRLARRVVSVPVLAVLGVREGGEKQLLALRLASSEAAANWGEVIADLQRRGLAAPLLVVVDGHQGLGKALSKWSGAKIQRCTVHKLRNLTEACPKHARGEMKRDYHRITHAADGIAARKAYEAFLAKWSQLCPAVARSLEEGGAELLTFYEFPKTLWSSIRSTNSIENLNRELRRRTKTQASFGTEQAAVTLLYGLVAFGQIRMNKIGGHRQLAALQNAANAEAA